MGSLIIEHRILGLLFSGAHKRLPVPPLAYLLIKVKRIVSQAEFIQKRRRAYPTWYATRARAIISRVLTTTVRQNSTFIDFVDNGRAI